MFQSFCRMITCYGTVKQMFYEAVTKVSVCWLKQALAIENDLTNVVYVYNSE